jgi:hypothetical protein
MKKFTAEYMTTTDTGAQYVCCTKIVEISNCFLSKSSCYFKKKCYIQFHNDINLQVPKPMNLTPLHDSGGIHFVGLIV